MDALSSNNNNNNNNDNCPTKHNSDETEWEI